MRSKVRNNPCHRLGNATLITFFSDRAHSISWLVAASLRGLPFSPLPQGQRGRTAGPALTPALHRAGHQGALHGSPAFYREWAEVDTRNRGLALEEKLNGRPGWQRTQSQWRGRWAEREWGGEQAGGLGATELQVWMGTVPSALEGIPPCRTPTPPLSEAVSAVRSPHHLTALRDGKAPICSGPRF